MRCRQAVALNSMTFNLARAVGPATAALAVEYLGIPAAFGLNALSYLVFIGALLLIGPQAQELADGSVSHLRASVDLLRRRPQLVVFLVIVASVGFASDPINTLAPAWAHAFGETDTTAGFIVGVFGAGAVTAGLVVAGRVGGRDAGWSRRCSCSAGGSWRSRCHRGWRSRCRSCSWPASATSARIRPRRRGCSSASSLGTRTDHGALVVAFLGLRPVASLVDGAVAAAFGVRVAGIVLALPALGCAVWMAVRARSRGWGPARAELPPA